MSLKSVLFSHVHVSNANCVSEGYMLLHVILLRCLHQSVTVLFDDYHYFIAIPHSAGRCFLSAPLPINQRSRAFSPSLPLCHSTVHTFLLSFPVYLLGGVLIHLICSLSSHLSSCVFADMASGNAEERRIHRGRGRKLQREKKSEEIEWRRKRDKGIQQDKERE